MIVLTQTARQAGIDWLRPLGMVSVTIWYARQDKEQLKQVVEVLAKEYPDADFVVNLKLKYVINSTTLRVTGDAYKYDTTWNWSKLGERHERGEVVDRQPDGVSQGSP